MITKGIKNVYYNTEYWQLDSRHKGNNVTTVSNFKLAFCQADLLPSKSLSFTFTLFQPCQLIITITNFSIHNQLRWSDSYILQSKWQPEVELQCISGQVDAAAYHEFRRWYWASVISDFTYNTPPNKKLAPSEMTRTAWWNQCHQQNLSTMTITQSHWQNYNDYSKLTSPQVGNPWVGISASCPVTTQGETSKTGSINMTSQKSA